MVVGIARLHLMIPEAQGLKEKRAVLRSVKDRVRLKFNCAIAEVASQDDWQEAVIGFAVVANERAFVESMVDKIVNFVEELALAKMVHDEKEILVYGDEAIGEEPSHWEPSQPSPMARPGAGPARSGRPKIPVRGAKR